MSVDIFTCIGLCALCFFAGVLAEHFVTPWIARRFM